jgi:transposase
VSGHGWLDRYGREHDPAALLDHCGGNPPTVWTADLLARLRGALGQSPDRLGYQAVEWTAGLLREHLAAAGEGPALATVRRELYALGYVWKRPRYVLQPDPEREKKRALRRRLNSLPPRSVRLFEDETDLLLFPPLRSAWRRRGEPAPVPLSGGNAKRVVFGALNIDTGRRRFLVRRRQRGADFRALLSLVRSHYRGWHVAVVLDEDSSPTAKDSVFWAGVLGIELLWLPKRRPEPNPLERLWGHGKDHVCANRQYGSIEEQAGRFVDFPAGLSNHEALKQAGLLSGDFWLDL